jgi:hypothetical protein
MWKDIPGYEHFYEVSDGGLIRNWSTWQILKPRVSKKDGSLLVNLSDGMGGKETVLVHRVVAEVFVENPEGFKIVKHKDGNKRNNTQENLYWARAKQKLKEEVTIVK